MINKTFSLLLAFLLANSLVFSQEICPQKELINFRFSVQHAIANSKIVSIADLQKLDSDTIAQLKAKSQEILIHNRVKLSHFPLQFGVDFLKNFYWISVFFAFLNIMTSRTEEFDPVFNATLGVFLALINDTPELITIKEKIAFAESNLNIINENLGAHHG